MSPCSRCGSARAHTRTHTQYSKPQPTTPANTHTQRLRRNAGGLRHTHTHAPVAPGRSDTPVTVRHNTHAPFKHHEKKTPASESNSLSTNLGSFCPGTFSVFFTHVAPRFLRWFSRCVAVSVPAECALCGLCGRRGGGAVCRHRRRRWLLPAAVFTVVGCAAAACTRCTSAAAPGTAQRRHGAVQVLH